MLTQIYKIADSDYDYMVCCHALPGQTAKFQWYISYPGSNIPDLMLSGHTHECTVITSDMVCKMLRKGPCRLNCRISQNQKTYNTDPLDLYRTFPEMVRSNNLSSVQQFDKNGRICEMPSYKKFDAMFGNSIIGISDDRLHHMLQVARKCYQLAVQDGMLERQARACFAMGLLHDAGYEFSRSAADHPDLSADLTRHLAETSQCIEAISKHGKPEALSDTCKENPYLVILNQADMSVDSKGRNVTPEQRLKDIADRYGKDSKAYIDSEQIVRYCFRNGESSDLSKNTSGRKK